LGPILAQISRIFTVFGAGRVRKLEGGVGQKSSQNMAEIWGFPARKLQGRGLGPILDRISMIFMVLGAGRARKLEGGVGSKSEQNLTKI